MPTFLTNPRMAPELAARVEASVSGRKSAHGKGKKTTRRLTAIARVLGVAAVAGLVFAGVSVHRRETAELEKRRAALLHAVQTQAATLTDDDKASVAHAESWLVRFAAQPYPGDAIDPAIAAPGALDAALKGSALYVRGPIDGFGNNAQIAAVAAQSLKDAFVLCLMDAPSARTEKVLLAKVRAAYTGSGLLEQRTANVRRLQDAEVGLPILMPPWQARVTAASDLLEVEALERELGRAPLARTKQALRASLLLVVIDEAAAAGPSELDGEKPHDARVGVIDLASGKILLRVRRRLDPTPWSQAARAEYAMGLDGCALAVDVREAAKR